MFNKKTVNGDSLSHLYFTFCCTRQEEGDCEYECLSLNFIETDICIRTDLQVRNNSFKSQRVEYGEICSKITEKFDARRTLGKGDENRPLPGILS